MITQLIDWISLNGIRAVGLGIAIISLFFLISELRVYFRHNSSEEMLWFWLSAFLTGMTTFGFDDIALGFFFGISVLMIQQTYSLRDVPVWGKLMLATTASYLTILVGKIAQMIFNAVTGAPESDERIFAIAFSSAFFVFLIVSFIFFGKKFILVSRFSSPQIVYLLLFGVIYFAIATRLKELRELFYLDTVPKEIARHVLFLSFGVYEILAIVMVLMYMISGWLLHVLFGVKNVEDEFILSKVSEIASKLGIKGKVKVGYVRAPILNAFAYGPFFDKRIAFISSNLEDFTESDLNGIVGHELAHTAKNHVLLLLGLSIFELALKKALLLPATQLDYAVFSEGLTVDFVTYIIISYGLVIFLYIFVRALEGHADKVTKDVGYGEDLSKALYRLEGFYQGVAADFGISVNLLTDKKYTKEEKERFEALAGRRIYRETIQPTRGAAFSNIFVSHPRTSYRIAALVTDKITPAKAAFLPYRLVWFRRKGPIEILRSAHEQTREILDSTFVEDFGETAFERLFEILPFEEEYKFYVGKNVLLVNLLSGDVTEGVLEKLEKVKSVTNPIAFIVNGKHFPSGDHAIKILNLDQPTICKNGEIFYPESYRLDEEEGVIVQGKKGNQKMEVRFKDLGLPVEELQNLVGRNVFLYEKGKSRLVKLNAMEIQEKWSRFKIQLGDEWENGEEFIVGFSPIGVEFKKEKTEEDFNILESNIGKKIGIYSKENYDILIPGVLEKVDRENNTITMKEENGSKEHKLELIDYILTYEPNIELIRKDHISIFTKLGIWWENRKGFNYIS
ncbi:MAG: hypothetical protein D6732_05050 [Methanobacteriota archaeon]|nr:MAG: hypothetical protein D6732_05050 [Euryarchaeota archaeon]